MATQVYTRIPNGGFNRAVEPHALGPDEWYDLLNFRPMVGALRQTAPIVQKQAITLFAGEGAVSQIKYLDLVRTNAAAIRYLLVNHTNARYIDPTALATQTLIPCVLQTAVPNNTTVTSQCLLYGINATDFTAAGDYISVVIQAGGITFKWSRNGGALSGALSIGPAVAVGVNGLYVSFLDTTGYTVGDTWTWTQQATIPYSAAVTSTAVFPYHSAFYKTDVYLGGIGRNIMRVRDGFITSVGYKRVYGKYVGVFENHLMVGHFAEGVYDPVSGVSDPYDAANTPFEIGMSDLDNPDCFFSTSINEADSFSIPYNTVPDSVNFGITGAGALGTSWWWYLSDAIYETVYLGLPNVFQTRIKFPGVGCAFPSGLVCTKRGHYFMGRDNFYFFDGVQPQALGEQVRTKVFAELVAPTDTYYEKTYGFYDSARQEVVWTYWTKTGTYYQARQVIFMEKYGRWYFRNLPSTDSGATDLTVCSRVYNTIDKLAFGGSGYLYYEYDAAETLGNTVTDAVSSLGVASYTQPYCISPDLFYRDLFITKETSGIWIDANWTSGVTGLQVSDSSRVRISDVVTMTAGASLWTPTTETYIGTPRTSGKVFRFQFLFSGTKPLGCVLSGWGDSIYAGSER